MIYRVFPNSYPDGSIDGPNSGTINVEYTFSVYLSETDGDQVYYKVDWGDGSESSWVGPVDVVAVGIPIKHTYSRGGNFDVFVTVVDIHGALTQSSHHNIKIDEMTQEPPGGGTKCFLAGTKILMSDNSLKNIENIKVGDLIMSFDESTGTIKEDKIVDLFHFLPEDMIEDFYLIINGRIRVTINHPLFINGKWIRADELKLGDPLAEGVVTSIDKVYERVPTYNFATEIYHTYLVKSSNELIIAHNENPTNPQPYKEEIVTESEQISATDDDYPAIISMGKIESLREYSYDSLRSLFGMPDGYHFLITISNSHSVFAVVGEDGISTEGLNVRATQKESVIIYDGSNNQYIFAILQITIFK